MESILYKDHLEDNRVDCYSILCTITVEDYIGFIEHVWVNKGGIEGQRSPLKTKSAQRIRKRMIDDLSRGTVIPAIVVGAKINVDQFNELSKDVALNSIPLFKTFKNDGQISIIDGMQRTTALREALSANTLDGKKIIRLELWIAKSTNSLIYRMLVLNSGQIPWSIKRQLEVVFSQLRLELESNVKNLKLFDGDSNESRNRAGEYQASQFVELFMLFGTRRINIDIQEQLAEEFARLDIIETSGNTNFMEIFIGVSKLLVDLDFLFSKLSVVNEIPLTKFQNGKKIFSSQPARAGFIVAASQEIFGIPGIEYSNEIQLNKFKNFYEGIEFFIESNSQQNQPELSELIDLPTLDEQVNIKQNKVGEFERNFFLKSFKTFIDLAKNKEPFSLTPCWRASH